MAAHGEFAPPPDVVDVLADECEVLSATVVALDEPAFARATRCEPWDVKALLGHVWRAVDRIVVYGSDPPAPVADSDAIRYYQTGYDRVADAADVVRKAEDVAAMFSAGTDLARSFDQRRHEAVAFARSLPPDRLVKTFGPSLRLDEYLCTRSLEVAVHGLDLADALAVDPWITPRGAELVRAMLVGLLGEEPPPALGWDELAFIEAGTGRRRLNERDRSILGLLLGRFPLLA